MCPAPSPEQMNTRLFPWAEDSKLFWIRILSCTPDPPCSPTVPHGGPPHTGSPLSSPPPSRSSTIITKAPIAAEAPPSAAVESRAAATGAPIVTAAEEIGQLGLNVQIGQLGRLTSISLRPLRNCAGDFQVLCVFNA